MRTTFHDQLVLTLNMKDIRVFQTILMLILDQNNKIMSLDSEPMDEFMRFQNLAKQQRENLTRSQLGTSLMLKPSASHDIMPMVSPMSMSIKSEGRHNEVPDSVVRKIQVD